MCVPLSYYAKANIKDTILDSLYRQIGDYKLGRPTVSIDDSQMRYKWQAYLNDVTILSD